MRYSTFEQAAVEASAGVKEIDAEMQRLKAKRDLLATIAQQLTAVLPAIAEAFPASSEANQASMLPASVPSEQPSYSNGAADSNSYPAHQDQWSSHASADSAPVAYSAAPESEVTAKQEPSFSDLLAQSKTFSLRNEGWPNSSAVDQRGLRQLL